MSISISLMSLLHYALFCITNTYTYTYTETVGVLQQANQEVPKDIYKYPLITKKKSDKLYGDFGPKADLVGKKATKITFD